MAGKPLATSYLRALVVESHPFTLLDLGCCPTAECIHAFASLTGCCPTAECIHAFASLTGCCSTAECSKGAVQPRRKAKQGLLPPNPPGRKPGEALTATNHRCVYALKPS
eukprot:1160989-Pelagomonas_calceolata.AAC.9